jgi:opacity protein-like surface antigen
VTLQIRGDVPVSNRLSLSVYAGPAWISVNQPMVTSIDYAESYPYDTATFRSAALTTAKTTQSALGVGAGLSYFFSKQIGLGVSARFVGGNGELAGLNGAPAKSKIGGADIGGGLRLRF